MPVRGAARLGALGAGLLLLMAAPALAQAHHPFSVGISEGGGAAGGPMGWILAQQGSFERAIAAALKGSRTGGALGLMGLSFLYGILHAAGPGHGKAVLAAYMVASRRALGRGIVLSLLAALLQAAVAIAIVALLSLVFHATAAGMRGAAAAVETLSYVGIALLGAWMLWRKGRAFLARWRTRSRPQAFGFAWPGRRPGDLALAFTGPSSFSVSRGAAPRSAGFACVAAHEAAASCGHCHAPDPAALDQALSWRAALSTVAAAGARPCSGAILVLVFGLAQGLFPAAVASTLVMALGTALTTAALASVAVLAKSLALRLCGEGSGGAALVGAGLECLAAGLVLAVGLSLLLGIGPLQGLA